MDISIIPTIQRLKEAVQTPVHKTGQRETAGIRLLRMEIL